MGHRDDVLTDEILDIWRGDWIRPIQNKVCDINIEMDYAIETRLHMSK